MPVTDVAAATATTAEPFQIFRFMDATPWFIGNR
jgi:hypothetical protein